MKPPTDNDTVGESPAALESPTGRFAVRGPTAFVLGLMLLVAVASITRTCSA